MKYLKINLDSIKLKGDVEDMETLQVDLYEKIQSQLDDESLSWSVDEDEEDEDDSQSLNPALLDSACDSICSKLPKSNTPDLGLASAALT